MGFYGMGEIIILLLVIVLAIVASVGGLALPGCSDSCGDVKVPYPFGTTEECSRNPDFLLNCNTTTTHTALMRGNLKVISISLQGQLKIQMFVARKCYYQSGHFKSSVSAKLRTASHTVSSTENKFVAVGCDTYGYLNSFQDNGKSSTGCLSRCNRNTPDLETNKGNCSGIGCCQVDIPRGMNNISIEAYSFNNHTNVWDINNCSYAFVVERGWYKYSYDNLQYLPKEMVPMVFDWAIGDETCEIAKQNTTKYACKGPNTKCSNSTNGSGYRCECKEGFKGNPYLPRGCQGL
ncbi:Wall-associated receptor kinase [Quillaja saponaria]|uniref:Wall-associated receptor kinase n=1 Tax=Quillaja saponaria TaxID=32244 RepID=A0AAD7LW70_QUISA|nr:Wall-associated receptor kinase [Quillaja saponaria]